MCWGVHVGWARLIFTLNILLGCSDSLLEQSTASAVGLSVWPKIGFRLLMTTISRVLCRQRVYDWFLRFRARRFQSALLILIALAGIEFREAKVT